MKNLKIYTIFCLSGYRDSNAGPPAPKAGALTGLRYTPKPLSGTKVRIISQSAIPSPQENPLREVMQEGEVTRVGFKPTTFRTGIWRSIQLSYGANKLVAKMQPASAKKVYFQFAERSYILCKGIASECKESLLSVCRAQLYLMQR